MYIASVKFNGIQTHSVLFYNDPNKSLREQMYLDKYLYTIHILK